MGKRDCYWEKIGVDNFGLLLTNVTDSVCLPRVPPGLNFWDPASDAASVCAQANAQCVVEYEKGLFDKNWDCEKNCDCTKESWENAHVEIAKKLGDCATKINWVGKQGFGKGYAVSKKKLS